jgi:hypothetical protein
MSGGVDSSVAALALLHRRGPRGRGRHDAPVGRRQRHRLLLGRRRRRRPSSGAAARHRPPRLQLLRRVRPPRRRALRGGRTPGSSRPTRASSATATSSSPACCERADVLGFDAVATGHHARIVERGDGMRYRRPRRRCSEGPELRAAHARPGARSGADAVPRRSSMTKAEVRSGPRRSGCGRRRSPTARTSASSPAPRAGGREQFLGARIPFHRAEVVDRRRARLGEVEAVELVTIGQRRGIGLPGGGPKQYVVDVEPPTGDAPGRGRRR